MRERFLHLAIYWGAWLLLPVLIDGVNALVNEFRPGDFTQFAIGPVK